MKNSNTKATANRLSRGIVGKINERNKAQENIDDKVKRIQEFRREASRLSSIANKRIERLERNGLTDSPAYKRYIKDGGARFGVKGKSFNQVQSETARLHRFINSQTSTIKGVNKVLKEMADNTGIKYKNLKELRAKAPKFFELSSKVEQYLTTVANMGAAIGYNKIWEAINEYTEVQGVDLSDGKLDIDEMVGAVTKALTEFEKPVSTPQGNFYVPKDE